MSLVTLKELLADARAGGYAVGAFNVHGMEIAQAVAAAAERAQAPVIFQVNQGTIKYAGIRPLAALLRTLAEDLRVPAAIHLDHGTSFEVVVQCLRHGFTSVMIDGSRLPYAENAALVRKVVEVAHGAGVSVEAELGRIGGMEDDLSGEGGFTDPHEAARFVEETGVDALAVAIGTAHGVYQGEPKLDFERLAAIRERVAVPLVMHGASGVPEGSVRRAVELGIRKVNLSTELKIPFTAAIRAFLTAHPEEFDPRKYLGAGRQAVEETVFEKIVLVGAAGRAAAREQCT
ncbi:MAG: class II fructose-1,6-bisphosphate aldolase [Bacillota bacterium]|nr:class II fructose-1,6-bisphosphate aldolase [Bacillota bacterium]